MCDVCEKNDVLNVLINMKNHIEVRISCINEFNNFKESLKTKNELTPFIDNFIDEYVNNKLLDKDDIDVKLLKNFLIEINTQIKDVCKHEYYEDEIECGIDGSLKKITYCGICYLTF